MEVTDKLALEFNTIILSHVLTLLALFSFSLYVFFRAKRNVLLYSYLALVGSIALWLISKIFKTVSPVLGLRWFFIVTQYFAIDFLGVCLLVFAYVYLKDKLPSRGLFILWLILPAASFIVLLTNPLHMSFYSYFDIYKDRFGFMFYISQSVQYIYLLIGCVMLSRGYTRQPGFHGKRIIGRLFSVLVLLPLMGNLYYILYKMDVFPWVFPFPVFDFSPIAAFISLMLFMIPVLAFRFFDISPVSLEKLYDHIPSGIAFIDKGQNLYGANRSFSAILPRDRDGKLPDTVEELINSCPVLDKENGDALRDFIVCGGQGEAELSLSDGHSVRVTKRTVKNGHLMLCLNDITQISRNRGQLREQNKELERVNRLLDSMAENAKQLAIARTKAQMAQNVHDILGHSLTVVIGTAELASADGAVEAKEKLGQIEELLTGSLNDLRNTFNGEGMKLGQTSLTKALGHLKNDSISVDINIHGRAYELDGETTQAVYRLCQEAVTNAIKHGRAKNIYIILRYRPKDFEVYAVDNGIGCGEIKKSYGLEGIEKRITQLGGRVSFASDGECGFTIHAGLPRKS